MNDTEKISKIYDALVGNLENQGLIGLVHDVKGEVSDTKEELNVHKKNTEAHSIKSLITQIKNQWVIISGIFLGILGMAFFIIKAFASRGIS